MKERNGQQTDPPEAAACIYASTNPLTRSKPLQDCDSNPDPLRKPLPKVLFVVIAFALGSRCHHGLASPYGPYGLATPL